MSRPLTTMTAFLAAMLGDRPSFLLEAANEIVRKEDARARARRATELRMRSMEGHQPGRVVAMSDGTCYRVSQSGAWIRESSKRFLDRPAMSRGAKRRVAKELGR